MGCLRPQDSGLYEDVDKKKENKLQKRVTPDETEKTSYGPEHELVKQKQTLNKGGAKQTKTSQWELEY